MAADDVRERAIRPLTCDNEDGPGGVGSTSRGLTHLSDLTGRGLGVSLPIEDRLWSRVSKTPEGCWEYTGTRTHGYGQIGYQGRTRRTHRVAYELAKGTIPDGMVVMHTCDNPPCINPDHLSVGTHQDNMRDRDAKGRNNDTAHGWQRNLTHCKNGHPFDDEHTRFERPGANGVRRCRTCFNEWQRAYRAAKRGAA